LPVPESACAALNRTRPTPHIRTRAQRGLQRHSALRGVNPWLLTSQVGVRHRARLTSEVARSPFEEASPDGRSELLAAPEMPLTRDDPRFDTSRRAAGAVPGRPRPDALADRGSRGPSASGGGDGSEATVNTGRPGRTRTSREATGATKRSLPATADRPKTFVVDRLHGRARPRSPGSTACTGRCGHRGRTAGTTRAGRAPTRTTAVKGPAGRRRPVTRRCRRGPCCPGRAGARSGAAGPSDPGP
jgi:hypothetical protein